MTDMGRERRDASRLLRALENGDLDATGAAAIAERLDPALLHAIVSYLRAAYPASDPAATAVLDRVVRLTAANPALVRKHKEGAEDPVSLWFESEYTYREFRGRGEALLDVIAEKIDS